MSESSAINPSLLASLRSDVPITTCKSRPRRPRFVDAPDDLLNDSRPFKKARQLPVLYEPFGPNSVVQQHKMSSRDIKTEKTLVQVRNLSVSSKAMTEHERDNDMECYFTGAACAGASKVDMEQCIEYINGTVKAVSAYAAKSFNKHCQDCHEALVWEGSSGVRTI